MAAGHSHIVSVRGECAKLVIAFAERLKPDDAPSVNDAVLVARTTDPHVRISVFETVKAPDPGLFEIRYNGQAGLFVAQFRKADPSANDRSCEESHLGSSASLGLAIRPNSFALGICCHELASAAPMTSDHSHVLASKHFRSGSMGVTLARSGGEALGQDVKWRSRGHFVSLLCEIANAR